jgi:hypothetical protein
LSAFYVLILLLVNSVDAFRSHVQKAAINNQQVVWGMQGEWCKLILQHHTAKNIMETKG